MSRQVRDAVPPRSAWGRVGWLQRVALAAMPAVLIGLPGAAFAQDGDAVAAPPTVIDIKVDTTPPDADELRECTPREEDAAAISGEIVVCGRRAGSEHRLYSADDARERYARETMYAGDPQAPDVAGPGIFRGPATISGLCIIPPCPPPPAYMVDFSQLPATPPGSDADRIGRGLAPLGDRPPDAKGQDGEGDPAGVDPTSPPDVSPTGSASPEVPR